MTSTTTSKSAETTTNNTTPAKNRPSHEIFVVEGEGEDTVWTKVGVAFPTKSGRSHRVLIGQKDDPKRKVFLVCPNSQFDGPNDGEGNARPGDEARRKPYADIFDATNNDVDFKKRDGVAFLNRDDSLSLLIGERGDPNQLKYQMRDVKPFKRARAS